MSDILMKRDGSVLKAWDALAEDDLRTLPENSALMVKVTRKRSLPHHRLYFQCLRSMVKSGANGTESDIHSATKIKVGLVSICQLPSGEYMAFPDSIAFDKLDQTGFNQFFAKAVAFWKACGLWNWLSPDLRVKLSDDQREAA
ncbi:MAG: hypothetical protein QM647_13085 [Asticcacaulis sp.]|uniref:hypothetical protein n=1 Tax=Asticcacaulis sp. TaxID=1872648 RepID=UPI0039E6EF4D